MLPIKGYEHNYTLSKEGEVTNINTGLVLTHHVMKIGYTAVSLWKNNVGTLTTLHRLIATHFIPNPENKPEVNHINGVKTDFRIENLEWVTRSENIQHAYSTGLNYSPSNFTNSELEQLLESFLQGIDMTSLAVSEGVGLSRLSINLRALAEATNRIDEFEEALAVQKQARNIKANESKKHQIGQYTLDGTFVAFHESLTSAAKALGKSSSGSISNCLNPNTKQDTAFGFTWRRI